MGKPIEIHVGVCTKFTVKLANTNFTGIEKFILTIKNKADVSAPVIIEREYTEPKNYEEIIHPEESVKLKDGAVYDFNKVLVGGKRHAVRGSLGPIVLVKGAGGCLG